VVSTTIISRRRNVIRTNSKGDFVRLSSKIVSILFFATVVKAPEGVAAQSTEAIIVPQEAPLSIASYTAEFQRGSQYRTEGIRHDLEYRNNTDREIVASQIGLVSFSVFNEFLDRTNGVDLSDIRPGDSEKGSWVARAYSDFTFLTGVAYVSKVRFADGEIWEADLGAVEEALRQIEEDFDMAKLDEEDEDS
jgi:hypothetical protein